MPPPPLPSSEQARPVARASRPRGSSQRPSSGARSLAAIAAAIAAAWLLLLPLVARTPTVERHIRRNESHGVDPSAKFYSELPAMPELWQRIKRAQANRTGRHPAPASPSS